MEHYDIFIVGAGAAGIAAARGAWEAGCRSIALADRKPVMGGVLLQCTHRGFGRNVTGPEYLEQLLQDFPEEIVFYPGTTVLSLSRDRRARLSGGKEISFGQLLLAAGCREIPMGALPIAGTRPEGIYTAGQMQELINLHGFRPEGPAVILGSGDMGLILADALASRGIPVTIVEQRERCGGMARNQGCLHRYPIRLICADTLAQVHGYPRITGCTTDRGEYLPCHTLLIAAGMRPERDLTDSVGNPGWLQICGNCSSIHPMVEAVVHEGKQAGRLAWEKIRGSL